MSGVHGITMRVRMRNKVRGGGWWFSVTWYVDGVKHSRTGTNSYTSAEEAAEAGARWVGRVERGEG